MAVDNIEKALVAILEAGTVNALVTNRIAAVLHRDYSRPAIWFQEVSRVPHDHLNAEMALNEARYQFECVGASADSAFAVGEAARTDLHRYRGTLGTIHIRDIVAEMVRADPDLSPKQTSQRAFRRLIEARVFWIED